jgi:hypothetical protein
VVAVDMPIHPVNIPIHSRAYRIADRPFLVIFAVLRAG